MKRYNVSRTIPLETLVRAYELWIVTDLSLRQVSEVLGVAYGTLHQAIARAEDRGLYND